MKHQYFGDIYDYLKYALLRQLSRRGQVSTAICWMLTKYDETREGHRIHYLREPEKWSQFDPVVFGYLQRHVLERGVRNVKTLESSRLLPNSRFYTDPFTDDPTGRHQYFEKFLEFARGTGLAFFDPDNGIEIKSVKYGRKSSSKYLYWREIEQSYAHGYTLLIYQHLPPKPREQFIDALASKFSSVSDASVVYSISTPRVAFLVVPQKCDLAFYQENVAVVEKVWTEVARVREHWIYFGG